MSTFHQPSEIDVRPTSRSAGIERAEYLMRKAAFMLDIAVSNLESAPELDASEREEAAARLREIASLLSEERDGYVRLMGR